MFQSFDTAIPLQGIYAKENQELHKDSATKTLNIKLAPYKHGKIRKAPKYSAFS